MSQVALRISKLSAAAVSASRKPLAASRREGRDLVVESALPATAPLNDHLVWLWGMLKHERRYLKSLQNEGANFEIQVPADRKRIQIKPNAAEMLHLLGITLTIGTG